MYKLIFVIHFLMISINLTAQDNQSNPFDWLPEDGKDTSNLGDSLLSDFDWSDWQGKDWEKAFKDDYKHFYSKEGADEMVYQAYQYANEQDITMPQHQEGITYDREAEEVYFESEADYYDRLNVWTENLNDELTQTGVDAALSVLYTELEPMLKALKEQNSALLDKILPQGKGIPVMDPLEKRAKKKQEGKKNFKYWVKLAAENVMQTLFKKNAEGKYELQREKIELLKQVGIIRFLKMSAMDWEIMQSMALEVPDEILSYAHSLQEVYQSGEATFHAGIDLYRQINLLDTELNIPVQYDHFRELSTNMATNRLTLVEMANKRKKMLALTYRELAQRYRRYGENLNQKLKDKDELRMDDAERINTAEIASAYLRESLQLQSKAERLLSDSFTNSDALMKDNYVQQKALFRRLEDYF
ncbi:hypothetical protein WJR50_25480 [Catalinimonas sp. 4WD22]|uniref:hypothetical protein n=1 Tax=Catalinimonas locisalis TaxID=3133978 RepID=UPI003101A308